MIDKIISYSIHNKLVVLLFTTLLVGFGLYATVHISVGVMPDVTTNQVQVITTSRNLGTEDIEKFITYPIEMEMANLPGVMEVRSVSKFGLSVVTVVFEDRMGAYLPRQLISEKLLAAREKIPEGMGAPELGPISTGLGEIYQYTLELKPGYEHRYSATELRSIQDWIVKRQLAGIPGVVEINTWGGKLKQYEVALIPSQLNALNVSLTDVFRAVQGANENAGAAYIEKGDNSYFIRAEGMFSSIEDIEKVVVGVRGGTPLLVRDVAEVRLGHANRFGAITANGEGEKVMGQIMMLKGANNSEVIAAVKQRIEEVQQNLPEGIYINGFLERSELVNKTVSTVKENLILGALIVIFILVLLMGNFRSGLIVASVIPLSLLFGLSIMYLIGMDVNLMSLGAIDFGILIDGAVIIVEFVVFQITSRANELKGLSKKAFREARNKITYESSSKMMNSAFFGQLIILIVFIPILTLTGIEGKMFKPMAYAFGFILIGAVVLCLTYVPMMASAILKAGENHSRSFSERIMRTFRGAFEPIFEYALNHKKLVLALTGVLFLGSIWLFTRMGGEFLPTLDEGDFVIQPVLKPGTSLSRTIELSTEIEKKILSNFPEVSQVVTRIGAAEIPTDPMSMEMTDVIVKLRPKSEWVSARTKDELADEIKEALSVFPGIEFEFTQPIEMRFNELISGIRSDVAIKIFGEDMDVLNENAGKIKELIHDLQGVSDLSIEKVAGLPQVRIRYKREQLAKFGLTIGEVNRHVQAAFAGLDAGQFFEGEKVFDVVVRYHPATSRNLPMLQKIIIDSPNAGKIPLTEVAEIELTEGPAQISRENSHRRIVIGINIRNRDMESLIHEIDGIVKANIQLPDGYYITYGGQFENLERARARLLIAGPVALALIFVLLFFAFGSITETLIVFTGVPLAAIGGILALFIRGMPFSISAGIGFIALFGIAVLNGIVLMSYFNELAREGVGDVVERVRLGTKNRFRPVILTAATDVMGFMPMALSASAGAEVQRPLATVVIGGLVSSFFLTLVIIPILYVLFEKKIKIGKEWAGVVVIFLLFAAGNKAQAQPEETRLSFEECVVTALENNLELQASKLAVERQRQLEKTAWNLGPTRLFYSTEEHEKGIQRSGVYSMGVQQGVAFPGKYTSITKLRQAETQIKLAEYRLKEMELRNRVAKAYQQLLYAKNKLAYLQRLDSLFEQLMSASGRRFEAGEISYLESLSAKARYNDVHTQYLAAVQEENQAVVQLKTLLYVEAPVDIKDSTLQKLRLEERDAENAIPQVLRGVFDSRSAFYDQSVKTFRSDFLPDFNLQYYEQRIDGNYGFNGFQVGVDIPLFYNAARSKVEAAKVDKEINERLVETEQSLYSNEVSRLNMELARQEGFIDYFEETGIPLANEIVDVAQRSYEAGEVGYLQYVQSMNEAINIRLGYLQTLLSHNLAAIEIMYYYKSTINETY